MTSNNRTGFQYVRWLLFVPLFVIGMYCVLRLTLDVWVDTELPKTAPRIAFSLDSTWLNELGITSASYEAAFTRHGARLIAIKPGSLTETQSAADFFKNQNIDGLVLSGGGDVDPELYGASPEQGLLVDRQRDEFEIALVKEAKKQGIPVLGICRGAQLLNVAFGGTLQNLRTNTALNDRHFSFSGHSITLSPKSLLASILGVEEIESVTSFHGQAISKLGREIRLAAQGEQGITEAIEYDGDEWIIGVQWHPELAVTDEIQNKLLAEFIVEAKKDRSEN